LCWLCSSFVVLTLPFSDSRSFFCLLSLVSYVEGKFAGQTGRVVSVVTGPSSGSSEQLAIILTDGLNTEIQCNISFLQISDEVASGLGNLMGYELYDLVALNDNESGVIINVGMERLKVINHLGVVKDIVPQEIRSKLNHVSLRNKSFDGYSNSFGVNDTLTVVSGSVHLKLTGTVKHINKGNVWLHSNHYLKNSGIFVIKGRNCMLVGGSSAGGGGSAGNTGGMGMGNNSYNAYAGGNSVGSSSQQSTPSAGISQRYGGGGGNVGGRGGGGGRGRGDTRHNEMGTTVRIIKGGFKGHLGQIIDVTSTHYSIEMLTKLKKIVIPKKDTIPVGNRYGSYEKANTMSSMNPGMGQSGPEFGMMGGGGGGMGSSTPFLSAPTPIHLLGSETPALFGNETPYMGMGGSSGHFDDDSAWKITDTDRAHVQNTSLGNASELGGGGNSIMSGLSGSMIGGNDRLSLPVPSSSSISGYTPSAMSDFSVTPQHYSNTNNSRLNTPLDQHHQYSGQTSMTSSSSSSLMGGAGGGNDINFMPGMVVLMKKGKHIGKFAVIHQIVDDVSFLSFSCFCRLSLSFIFFLEL
jgi:transcription elongation factor